MATNPEVWLRGPPDVPSVLQPVAHALLQAREEVDALTSDFADELLWERPNGVASVGFHLRHLTGVVDRLFTYARGESLSTHQLEALRAESTPGAESLTQLRERFHLQVDGALEQLRTTQEAVVLEARSVGRAQLPSTVLGLLFHVAEHTQRHVGQLLVTVRIQRSG